MKRNFESEEVHASSKLYLTERFPRLCSSTDGGLKPLPPLQIFHLEMTPIGSHSTREMAGHLLEIVIISSWWTLLTCLNSWWIGRRLRGEFFLLALVVLERPDG